MLLSIVFLSFMLLGTVWTIELQRLLTETAAVETILTTLLSGIILLVSIVVSINSIVLSYDLTSVDTQESRIEGVLDFQRELGQLTESDRDPVNPASFLAAMADVILTRTAALEETEWPDGGDEVLEKYIQSVRDSAEQFSGPYKGTTGAEFGVLWLGLEADYGPFVNRAQTLRLEYEDEMTEEFDARLHDLMEAFELFATGKEYFKTLYYTREVSQFSRILLVVALPAILINASSVLTISAHLLPDVWLLGLPPLQTFVAATFTISLLPYVILTAYVFRLATVARRSAAVGPFSLRS